MRESVKKFGVELFFPSFCLGCQMEGVFLCEDCRATLEISQYNYCLCNKNPFRLDDIKGSCRQCANKKLAGLYFALPYQERYLTKKLIYQFKYEPYLRQLAKPLAGIVLEHLTLANNLNPRNFENSVLVPVPPHIKKQKDRGYNQAELLAQELGQMLNVSSVLGCLIKIKETLPQMELSAKERQENLQGAFLVIKPKEVKGKKIFLVDDVYTTGATMEECATQLLASGAKSVWGISIAREG